MHAYLKAKTFQVNCRVLIPAMPYEIILPKHRFVRFATGLHTTDPVDSVLIMNCFEITIQNTFSREIPFAQPATVARCAVTLEVRYRFSSGDFLGLLNLIPGMNGIYYGGLRRFQVVGMVGR